MIKRVHKLSNTKNLSNIRNQMYTRCLSYERSIKIKICKLRNSNKLKDIVIISTVRIRHSNILASLYFHSFSLSLAFANLSRVQWLVISHSKKIWWKIT